MLLSYYLLLTLGLKALGQIADVGRLEHDLSKFLSIPRYNTTQKSWARMAIREALDEVGLQTTSHTFIPDEEEDVGVNLFTIQRGPHYNTPDDKVVVVCANYDTEEDNPGVDDNGSGVAAVLEIARTMATLDQLYERNNTIMYVLFDMKHKIFPTAARELSEHNHMGDFIQLIARINTDDILLQQYPTIALCFLTSFYRTTDMNVDDWSFHPWLLLLGLPVHAISSVKDMHRLHPYLYADHSSFFFHSKQDTILPTIYLSDTLKHRGVLQYCTYCGGLYMLTRENLRFLTTIVDAVIRTVVQLSESEAAGIVDELYFRYNANDVPT